MRYFLAILMSLALVSIAWSYSTCWHFPSGGDETEEICIILDLPCWIQIDWQDCTIEFDGVNDYWCYDLMGTGYYVPGTDPYPEGKGCLDPWAGADYYAPNGIYFESYDGADIYVHANNQLIMTVHTNGDLYGTCVFPNCPEDHWIPTWFTVALCPFMIDDVWLTTGTIPFSGGQQGCYLGPGTAWDFLYDNAAYNYPNQHAFQCNPVSQTWTLGPLNPEVQGTIKFLARIWRRGLVDAGDDYRTCLDVAFSTVPCGP